MAIFRLLGVDQRVRLVFLPIELAGKVQRMGNGCGRSVVDEANKGTPLSLVFVCERSQRKRLIQVLVVRAARCSKANGHPFPHGC